MPRHPLWLIPLGYMVAFVASWPGIIEADDGSGLPWIGVFALSGVANTFLACLIVTRLARRAKSN